MTTSTPPAWHWLEERYVPVTTVSVTKESPTTDPGYYPADVDEMCREYGQMREEVLSEGAHNRAGSATLGAQNDSESPVGSHKLPESATLRELNGDDPTGEDVWPLERAASATASSAVCADQCPNGERNPLSALVSSDQCPDCRCAPSMPHAPGCESTAQVADSVINAVPEHVERCVSEGSHEHPVDVRVESCPECGAVTDIDYGPDPGVIPKRETPPVEETFSVPFRVQEFMFEELADAGLEYLHDLLNKQSGRILEMARDRFRKGYAKYGSAAYQWDAETRLTNVIEELADAVVYQTTGSVE